MAPRLLDLFVGARQANGSVSEPSSERVDGDRQPVGGEERRAAGSDGCPVAGFERSQALFVGLPRSPLANPLKQMAGKRAKA